MLVFLIVKEENAFPKNYRGKLGKKFGINLTQNNHFRFLSSVPEEVEKKFTHISFLRDAEVITLTQGKDFKQYSDFVEKFEAKLPKVTKYCIGRTGMIIEQTRFIWEDFVQASDIFVNRDWYDTKEEAEAVRKIIIGEMIAAKQGSIEFLLKEKDTIEARIRRAEENLSQMIGIKAEIEATV